MVNRTECIIENLNKNYAVDVREWQEIAVKIFEKLVENKEIAEKFCLKGLDFESVFFDITFTDSVQTHELNKTYRNKDYPADIITFSLFADDENSEIIGGQITLGDIVIALDKVEETAENENKSFEYELKFLIAHGILHLLGFEHDTMEEYDFVVKHQNDVIGEIEE